MNKQWYIAPEHFRRQASSKTKQAKFRLRNLILSERLLDKKYVSELARTALEKKKSEAGN
jgi:hypothetical protein